MSPVAFADTLHAPGGQGSCLASVLQNSCLTIPRAISNAQLILHTYYGERRSPENPEEGMDLDTVDAPRARVVTRALLFLRRRWIVRWYESDALSDATQKGPIEMTHHRVAVKINYVTG